MEVVVRLQEIMASKQAEVKGLFTFFKLCGNLKVGSFESSIFHKALAVAAALEAHGMGVERSEGPGKCGVSHLQNGDDGILVWWRPLRGQRKVCSPFQA